MSTIRPIIDALSGAAAADELVVLATVVRISGSSYGGVGTRMVVRADGSTVGLVSGGCLESDLAEHAREVRATKSAKIVTYDTRGDDDAAWGLGLGCNGLFDVLLEPLDQQQARRIADILSRAQGAESPRIMATVIRVADERATLRVGAHALFLSDRVIMTDGDWSTSLINGVSEQTMDALKAGRRGLVREVEGLEIAIEVLKPPVRLLICGSGPDVLPFVRLATELGWEVTVLDHRSITAESAKRFPDARVIECSDATQLQDIDITPQTAVVVMSHNFDRDVAQVEVLIQSPAGYIGILGPRARTERMFANLKTRGVDASADARIFAPVGLDIGGDGPDAIALSIIAEISAVLTGRNGGHLRDKRGPLH
jgi:xanthine dehydrogenase accessory factor